MRLAALLLAMLAPVVGWSQCAQDTLGDSHVQYAPLWMRGASIEFPCGGCNVGDRIAVAQLLDNASIQLVVATSVSSPPYPDARVLVTRGCNEVHLDTCVQVGDPSTASLSVVFSTTSSWQVWVMFSSWQADSVMLFQKSQPIVHPPLPEPSLLLDSCGVMASVRPPNSARPGKRIDPHSMQPVEAQMPNSRYLAR